MAFDWKEIPPFPPLIKGGRGDLAHFLNGQSGVDFSLEASSRAAVSRAYYAAFCYARNYAHSKHGFSPTFTGRDHKLIRTFFIRKGLGNIASNLATLHQWRKQCDYDDTIYNFPKMLKSALQDAQEIFRNLR